MAAFRLWRFSPQRSKPMFAPTDTPFEDMSMTDRDIMIDTIDNLDLVRRRAERMRAQAVADRVSRFGRWVSRQMPIGSAADRI